MRLVVKVSLVLCLVLSTFALFAESSAAVPLEGVSAHFAVGEIENAEGHVHVSLSRADLREIHVELFDAEGNSLKMYDFQPRQGNRYATELNFAFTSAVGKVSSVRITGLTERQLAFDTGRLNATPMSCTGQCSPTRIECNNSCFLMSCTSAQYSCADTGSGCEATCTCLGCP